MSDDENNDKSQTLSRGSQFHATLSNLKTWYNSQYCTQDTKVKGKKRASTSDKARAFNARPPLVIILEDFEGFPALMLQDLIANMKYVIFAPEAMSTCLV